MKRKDFEAYQTYLALQAHFIPSRNYDYFKYQGKVACSPESLEKRKDRFYFTKLAKHTDVKGFLLANFLRGRLETWIGNIIDDPESIERYREWKKHQESMTYQFKQELKQFDDIGVALKVYGGQHPDMLSAVMADEVSYETLIILGDIYPTLFDYWDDSITDNVMWPSVRETVKAYKPFIEYDKEKCRGSIATSG